MANTPKQLQESAAKRFNITEPPEWWEAFKAQAKEEGMSVSEWLGECGLANLPREVRERLPERRGRGGDTRSKESKKVA